MTRAEIRRKAKELAKANKVYNFKTESGGTLPITQGDISKLLQIKDEEIENMKNEAMNEACEVAFLMLLSMPLIVAKDWLGFGNKRLNEFYKRIMSQYESYTQGYVKLSELVEILKNETDFEKSFKVDEKTLKSWDRIIEKE